MQSAAQDDLAQSDHDTYFQHGQLEVLARNGVRILEVDQIRLSGSGRRTRQFNGSLQSAQDLGLGLDAYDAVYLLASIQHQESGNALDIESLRSHRIFIHVQLGEADASRHLRGKLIDHWRDHPAWTAPGGPHID